MVAPATLPRKRYSYGPEVISWIEKYCVYPSGEKMGEPFILMPWQREWITDLYETDATGTLRYRWALLGIPKANGKSPLASALACYHLLGDPDEDDPWVVVAAASDKQADIVFDGAKRICEKSATLNPLTIRYRWEIRAKGGSGKLERVAAAKGKLDGKLISFLVIDELHEWTEENWIILTGGAMKRDRAQIIQLTTAGFDEETICFTEYEKGQRIASGEEDNQSYLFRWHGAPEGADYRDPKVWQASNPSWGNLVNEKTLADLCRNIPESQFRRYRLNQWVETEDAWLPQGLWESRNAPFEFMPKAPVAVGWDASTKNDSTGIVAVGKRRCARGKMHLGVIPRVWERPWLPDGRPDENWRLPIVECEDYIRQLCECYTVSGIAYDPAFITWSAGDLEAAGLPMVEWPQTPGRMVPATAALYEQIVGVCECGEPLLQHNGDAALARHVRNAAPRAMRGGGMMLVKGTTKRKIDLAIAMVMAVGEATGDQSRQDRWIAR